MTSSPIRVLIVDDEPIPAELVQFALESQGFHCDLAASGEEALQRIGQCSYDAVVTDLLMPGMNGGELVIRLCSRLQPPVVVVHTSVLEPELFRGLKREGVDEIVCKPANYPELARKIKTLVEGRRLRYSWLGRWSQQRRTSSPMPSHPAARWFGDADNWIQSSPARRETFRFGIIILACILFGLGWGHSLTPQVAGVCQMIGLCGLGFYFCLDLVSYYRDQSRTALIRYSAERRLSRVVPVRAPQEQHDGNLSWMH
jgi:DNA-binding response OmpR family regulator